MDRTRVLVALTEGYVYCIAGLFLHEHQCFSLEGAGGGVGASVAYEVEIATASPTGYGLDSRFSEARISLVHGLINSGLGCPSR